jgi:hypothetical protein
LVTPVQAGEQDRARGRAALRGDEGGLAPLGGGLLGELEQQLDAQAAQVGHLGEVQDERQGAAPAGRPQLAAQLVDGARVDRAGQPQGRLGGAQDGRGQVRFSQEIARSSR